MHDQMLIGKRRITTWTMWVMLTITVIFIGILLYLYFLNQRTWLSLFTEYILMVITTPLALGIVGALIVSHRPRNGIGWLFCVVGAGLAFTGVVQQYTRYALIAHLDHSPIAMFITWLNFWTFIPIIYSVIFIVPLVFPDGRLPSPRWRPFLWSTIGAMLILTVSAAMRAGPVDASLAEVNNPLASAELQPLSELLGSIGASLTLINLIASIAAPIVRMRRAQGAERQQIKWFVYGSFVLAVSLILPIVLSWPTFTQDTLLSGILLPIGFAFLAASIGIGILRHRLYDIDVIIQRTAIYGTLTVLIISIYVLVVGYLGFLFGISGNLTISLAATGLVAVIFQPLRQWLQRTVNHLLYGERNEPYTVLSRLGQRLEAALDPSQVLSTVVNTTKDALKLPYAAIALEHEGEFTIITEQGLPAGDLLHMPLLYQGQTIGELIVSARAPNEQWTEAEQRLLTDVAHHAGVAVHGVRVMADLQNARERLVLAREDERRRLRRSLHDDVAPALAAFSLTAATAVELIKTDPQRASDVLTHLYKTIRTTIGDIRRLVYDLRPPTLDELGLGDAIRELADRSSSFYKADGSMVDVSRLHVSVELVEPLPTLPAAVEVAAYRIIQEALLNVTRHAQAHTCTIRLACPDQHSLSLEVIDDGLGIPIDNHAGVGMSSMKERAVELGGTCVFMDSVPSGTQVRAFLPITAKF